MIEYAQLKTDDGREVPRTVAAEEHRQFQAALARAGGQAPRDAAGRSMVWNKVRGWHSRDSHMLPTLGFRRSTDVGGLARLHQRMHAKRETKLAAERAAADRFRSAGVELFARASASALAFRDMFVAGRVLSPPGRVSMDERIGWQLAEFFGDYIPLEAVQARRARQGW